MKLDFNICIVNFPHSAAWIELAELIFYSLEELGFNVKIQYGKIEENCRNILFGAFLLAAIFIKKIKNISPNTIFVNTEQLYLDNNNWWPSNIYEWASSFQTWDYSDRNINVFKTKGINNVKKLEIGYQPQLNRIVSVEKPDIDVLFYDTIKERRKKIIDDLRSLGLNVHTLFGVYGKKRDSFISRAKIVLNLHHFDSHIFEIVRVFYLLTNRKAVVGEVGINTAIDLRILECINPSSYDELANTCKRLIENTEERIFLENKALENFSLFPQKIFMEKLLY